MKRNIRLVAFAATMAIAPTTTLADDSHAQMVMEHGAQVMPFYQNQAMHMFLPSETGGVIEVVVHDLNPRQIDVVRSHLLNEAARFARGDYSDPSYIHGAAMPGLGQLRAGASRVSVRYFETPTGAAITFSSADSGMVTAIHQWLEAQQRDHNGANAKHCDMNMPM
jgi:hypothetical protein